VGIGATTAFAIASQSPRTLILASRTRSKLDTVAAQVSEKRPDVTVKTVTLDLGSIESVKKAAAEIESLVDHLDVLINNAGGAHGLDFVATGRDADWETMLQTNVLGVLRMTRAILPLIPHNAGSTIINIGSVAGHVAYEGGAAYCAAKAGELQITRVLRLELNGTGIRVSTIDPGAAETEFSLVRFKGDAQRAEKVYEGMTPLAAEDIAEIMVWIAGRPPHVNIDELLVKPTDQAAMHKIYRRTGK